MITIPLEMARVLHKLIAEETGGDVGIRDEGLLDSALQSAFVTFDGNDLYPTKEEKAARIGFSLMTNHAFVDGNKRIGMYILMTFLELNGIKINCSDKDIVDAGLGVASGNMTYEDLLEWIKKYEE